MKQNKYSTIILAFFLVASMALVSSCKKNDDDNTTSPTETFSMSVSSPEEGATFHNGATVNINAEISNDTEMHAYEVKIVNKSNNNEVVFSKQEEHMHSKTYTISESWVNNVTMHSDMELEITVYIDHEGNTKTKSVHFHCHP